MDQIKPGWKTTEFWQSLIPLVLNALVLFGVFTTEQGAAIAENLNEVVALIFAIAGLIGSFIPAAVYIHGRSKLKASRI